MSDPKARAMPPIILDIRFRERDLVSVGNKPLERVNPFTDGFDVAVAGPCVYIGLPKTKEDALRGQAGTGTREFIDIAEGYNLGKGEERFEAVRQVLEVPRNACVIRWLVPATAKHGEDLVALLQGKAGFGAVHITPTSTIRAARSDRAEAARLAEQRAREAVAARPATEHLAKNPLDDDDEVGTGDDGGE